MVAFDYGIQMQTTHLSLFSSSEGIVTVSYVHIILSEEDAFKNEKAPMAGQYIRSVRWWLDGLIIKRGCRIGQLSMTTCTKGSDCHMLSSHQVRNLISIV